MWGMLTCHCLHTLSISVDTSSDGAICTLSYALFEIAIPHSHLLNTVECRIVIAVYSL